MKQHSRFETARKFLIFWCLFIGIGAVVGGVSMLIAPDGSILQMQSLLPFFQVLPFAEYLFQDYVFPGIALLVVNGLTNLVAAGFLFARKRVGTVLGGTFGITLMLWICIQFVVFPSNILSISYFFFGLIQAATGFAALVFYDQERFASAKPEYPNVGRDGKQLVVYFSRMGYCRRLAYETADTLGADIYEVTATERTGGTLGFWWCGRFGMHKWKMSIKPVDIELEKYEKVVVCSPIWVFELCGPMRSFCESVSGRIKSADYVLVHHQKSNYLNAASEMDALLKLKHGSVRSVCCRRGKRLTDVTL